MTRGNGGQRKGLAAAVIVLIAAAGAQAADRVQAPGRRFSFVPPPGWGRQVEGKTLVHYLSSQHRGARITVIGDTRTLDQDAAGYMTENLEYLKDVYENLKVLTREKTRVGSRPAERARFEYDVDAPRGIVRTRCESLIFIADRRMQAVDCTAPVGAFDAAYEVYKAVAASVALPGEALEPPTPEPEPRPEPVRTVARLYTFSEDGKYGFKDPAGKVVIQAQFPYARTFSEGLGVVADREGYGARYGYVDETGRHVIKPQFAGAGDFCDGLARVKAVEPADYYGKWGYIDRAARYVIKPQFEAASDFCLGLARVKADDEVRWIDRAGKTVPIPKRTGTVLSTKAISTVHSRDLQPNSLTFSRDGRRVAYARTDGDKARVNLDGKDGEAQAAVDRPAFNPAGTFVVYLARPDKDKKVFYMIVGDRKEGPYEGAGLVTYSADGEHVAYVAIADSRYAVVKDGKPDFMTCDGLGRPCLSADGSQVACPVKIGDAWRMVFKGVRGDPYDQIEQGSAVMTAQGDRVAYVARKGDRHHVVVHDGAKEEAGPPCDWASSLSFSADGKRLVYVTKAGEDMHVAINHKPQTQYEWSAGTRFDAEGKRLAFTAGRGKDSYLVVDDREYGPYRDIWFVTFCPDGLGLAWVATLPDLRRQLMINGNPGPVYDGISDLTFSPDGKRLAYVAAQGERRAVVVDGKPQQPYRKVDDLCFSPDGKHLAYLAEDDLVKGTVVVVDGVEGSVYSEVADVGFDGPARLHYRIATVRQDERGRLIDYALVQERAE